MSRRLFDEAWSQGHVDVIDEICAEGFVNHDPVLGDSDREAAKQAVTGYRQAFPDLEITVENQIAEGDQVATRWRVSLTHRGELFGAAPSGKHAEINGITIDRFEHGKIVDEGMRVKREQR